MKNNELLLSVRFENDGEEISLLLYKDITLKALLEAIYYGLKVSDSEHFGLFREYVKTHTEVVVCFRAKKELELTKVSDNLDKKLYELGIVTTSCLVIPAGNKVTLAPLFPRYDQPSLCDDEKMEYNISTRRIAVAEPSVIDILPAGEDILVKEGHLGIEARFCHGYVGPHEKQGPEYRKYAKEGV